MPYETIFYNTNFEKLSKISASVLHAIQNNISKHSSENFENIILLKKKDFNRKKQREKKETKINKYSKKKTTKNNKQLFLSQRQ